MYNEIIYSYTDKDAIEDGVLVALNNIDRVSNLSGLWNDLETVFNETAKTVQGLLDSVRGEVMEDGEIVKVDFGGIKNLWVMANENGGVTLMRPEDY